MSFQSEAGDALKDVPDKAALALMRNLVDVDAMILLERAIVAAHDAQIADKVAAEIAAAEQRPRRRSRVVYVLLFLFRLRGRWSRVYRGAGPLTFLWSVPRIRSATAPLERSGQCCPASVRGACLECLAAPR